MSYKLDGSHLSCVAAPRARLGDHAAVAAVAVAVPAGRLVEQRLHDVLVVDERQRLRVQAVQRSEGAPPPDISFAGAYRLMSGAVI
jgi:hypothetical protein